MTFKKGQTAWNKGKKLGPNPKQRERMLGSGKQQFYNKHDGYNYILLNGKYWPQHQIVWMKENGMLRIPNGFEVHHLDGNKLNNLAENLILLSNSMHSQFHGIINYPKGSYFGVNAHLNNKGVAT